MYEQNNQQKQYGLYEGRFGENKIHDILTVTLRKFFMGLALLTGVAVAFFFGFKEEVHNMVANKGIKVDTMNTMTYIMMGSWAASFATFIAYIWISIRIKKFKYGTIMFWYLTYAAANGVIMGTIATIYNEYGQGDIVLMAAGGGALLFGVAWIIGATTKANLQKPITYVFAALLVIVIAEMVIYFTGSYSTTIDLVISPIVILIMMFFIAFKVQRLKILETVSEHETLQKISLLFAWTLLADYINIVIRLIRILSIMKK